MMARERLIWTFDFDDDVDDHVGHNSSVLDSGVQEVILWGNYPWNQDQKLERSMVRCLKIKELFRERDRILASR